MANIKLFGLVLIITSLMLGLAAVATQTTTIQVGDTGILGDIITLDSGNYNSDGYNRVGASQQEWQRGDTQPISQLGFNRSQVKTLPGSNALDVHAQTVDSGTRPNDIGFVTVPVAYPLIVACGVGVVLWFLPELLKSRKPVQFTSNRRRRRR